jgi:hypothetical protein
MKSMSFSATVRLYWIFGIVNILIGFVISKWYSFQIATGIEGEYATDYSALWSSAVIGLIAFVLAYLLSRRIRWAYWAALLFGAWILIGIAFILAFQWDLLYFAAGIGLPIVRLVQGFFALLVVIALASKNTRAAIFSA